MFLLINKLHVETVKIVKYKKKKLKLLSSYHSEKKYYWPFNIFPNSFVPYTYAYVHIHTHTHIHTQANS